MYRTCTGCRTCGTYAEIGLSSSGPHYLRTRSRHRLVDVEQMKELTIPDAAVRDKHSVEILRVWIAEKQLWCSIKVGMYDEHKIPEEETWGVILADATRHIAAAQGRRSARSRPTRGGCRRNSLSLRQPRLS
jgi:Domain of unknown function (DUF5076)